MIGGNARPTKSDILIGLCVISQICLSAFTEAEAAANNIWDKHVYHVNVLQVTETGAHPRLRNAGNQYRPIKNEFNNVVTLGKVTHYVLYNSPGVF